MLWDEMLYCWKAFRPNYDFLKCCVTPLPINIDLDRGRVIGDAVVQRKFQEI